MNLVGVEQCITIVNWDKKSTWRKLAERVNLKSWMEILREKGYSDGKSNDRP